MIRMLDLRPLPATRRALLAAIPRAALEIADATTVARDLIEEVRSGGSAALRAQADRFDGGSPDDLRVSPEELEAAVADLDPAVRAALEEAIRRVRLASAAQLPTASVTDFGPDARVEQRWSPVRRAGLYVPGGKAVYPSSVVMNVVPAQAAGVESVVVVTPPQRAFGGAPHPVVLGALGLLGVTEVYAIGGAGAIGALAYGVDDLGLDPVDVITGPGNVYVASAKRLVTGIVGIDAEAGTTEIVVIADAGADPRFVAADLISQAEHDELAAAVLVTDSLSLVESVVEELDALVPETANAERVRAALTGSQSAIVLVDSLSDAARFAEAYGAEHLELQVDDPDALLASIGSAGAVFVGPHSPVSLGDYLAGSNHVLPTGGQARFNGGLSVMAFLRPQQIIRYGREGLAAVAPHIVALADAEHLPAHGEAVSTRFQPSPAR